MGDELQLSIFNPQFQMNWSQLADIYERQQQWDLKNPFDAKPGAVSEYAGLNRKQRERQAQLEYARRTSNSPYSSQSSDGWISPATQQQNLTSGNLADRIQTAQQQTIQNAQIKQIVYNQEVTNKPSVNEQNKKPQEGDKGNSTVDPKIQQRNANFSKAGNIMSSISSIGNSLVNANDKKSAEVQQADAAFDQTADAVSQMGPWGALAGGIMKAGGFASDILTKAGIGTDQMTGIDKALDSKFLKLTPVGLINAIGAKKSDAFSKDEETFNQLDGAYTGTESAVNSAAEKAGKKYGLFSRRQMGKANREIAEARRQQNIAMNVADQAKTSFQAQQSMTDMYANSSEFNSQGGWNNRMAVGQKGMKLFDKDYIKHIKNSVAKHKAKPTYEEWIKRVQQRRLSDNYAFGGIEAQKEKLQKEGIKVINNTVDLKIYQYREEK